MIGVIGGMGPLATVDFLHKVILATQAEDDEQHVPLLVSNDPRIPRRPAAIRACGGRAAFSTKRQVNFAYNRESTRA